MAIKSFEIDIDGKKEIIEYEDDLLFGELEAIVNISVDLSDVTKPKVDLPTNFKENFVINKQMTTFSMVEVLIVQTHFYQALSVLDILEKKGEDPKRINKLKTQIDKALKEFNKNSKSS